jgi:hypothetical protein
MRLTGHKTRSVFGRYNIVSDGDLRDAAVKLAAKAVGTNWGQWTPDIPPGRTASDDFTEVSFLRDR